jgi:hypothetical protein
MSPSSVLVDTNPNEVWFGNNPLVSHIKVFGCDAFVHVPKKKRSKLDKKEIKCIFIGYKEGMKGYKPSNHASRKTMYNRDAVFREVRRKSESEVMVQTKNNLEKMCFELRNEEGDLDESIESYEEVEQSTSVVRRSEQLKKPIERYSSPEVCFSFVLTTTNKEPKSDREEFESAEEKR